MLALALVAALPALADDQNPTDAPAQLSLADQARHAAWAGRIGEGVALMDQHLAANPGDRAALLDRARFLAWRGDHAAAIATLDAMGTDASDDAEAQALRARIYAWAGRRDTALALSAPLYNADPNNYDNAWTQGLAAHLGEWPHEALAPLATVIAAKPDATDTRALARAVRLPMFSSVGVPVSHYEDDDDIEIDTVGIDTNVRVSPTWRLTAMAQRREYSAPLTSPFAPVTGGTSVDERRVGVGARVAFSPDAALSLALANSTLDTNIGDDSETLGRLEFSHRASDEFGYVLRAERERVGASPRSVTLGVLRDTFAADALWMPTLRDRISGYVAFDDYNDGNRRHWVLADWRHAVVRADHGSLDLGIQGEWMHYDNNPGNGYYSPDNYKRIAPVASSYLSFGQNAGLYLQAAVGAQRDETFDKWRRAVDVGAELTIGIYTRWQLIGRVGYSERLNQFGKYEGTTVGLELRYRFCDHRPDECPAAAE